MQRYICMTLATIMVTSLLAAIYQPSGVTAAAGDIHPLPPSTTVVIDNQAENQVDPHIAGTLVTYTSQTGPYTEIRHHDLATSDHGVVPDGGMDLLSDTDGSIIVFTRFNGNGASTFAFDPAQATTTELAPEENGRYRAPDIGGNTVVWEDFGAGPSIAPPEILVHDLSNNSTIQLTDDDLDDYAPSVSPNGTVITWQKCDGECDIWQATQAGSGWVTTQLTSGEGNNVTPVTNGEIIVYVSTRDGETDIYWQPVGGGQEQQISLSGGQESPSIDGNVITFGSDNPETGHLGFDVVLYDLSSDTLYAVTATPEREERLADVTTGPDGTTHVVYGYQEHSGNYDIHAVSFTLPKPDTTAPSLSLPDDMTVNATGPDGATIAYEVGVTDDTDPEPDLSCEPPSGSVFAIGTTTVTCTATDEASNQAQGSFSVTVVDAVNDIDGLIVLIESYDLRRGTEFSLKFELRLAQAALDRGYTRAGCAMLSVFSYHVRALEGRSLTPDQVVQVTDAVDRTRLAVGCS